MLESNDDRGSSLTDSHCRTPTYTYTLPRCVSPCSSPSPSSTVSSPTPRKTGHETHRPPSSSPPVAAAASVPRADANGQSLVARKGLVPISGHCARDSQCASGCCGFLTAKCASPVVAQDHDGGCGHGSNRKHKARLADY